MDQPDVDEGALDVVPVVFGSGNRYSGSVEAQHPLNEGDVVIQVVDDSICDIGSSRGPMSHFVGGRCLDVDTDP